MLVVSVINVCALSSSGFGDSLKDFDFLERSADRAVPVMFVVCTGITL
jgi:hypothetical protein